MIYNLATIVSYFKDPFEVRGDPAVGQEMVPRIARLSTASKVLCFNLFFTRYFGIHDMCNNLKKIVRRIFLVKSYSTGVIKDLYWYACLSILLATFNY